MASANFELKDMPMWSEPGKGPTMNLRLFYNRIATQRMATNAGANYYAFGDKWSFNFFSHLTETPNSGVDIVLPGGKVQRFDTNYVPVDIWNRNTLAKTNGFFVLEFYNSGNKWYYNTNTSAEQHLEKIEDKYGDAVTLQYDNSSGRLTNIVDALNHSFRLTYNGSGYVTNVVDSFGRNARFAYQGSDLVSLTDMGALTTTIQYNTNHWPTNIIYPSGQSWRVFFQQGAYGYNEPFRMIVTDPLGQTNEYFYQSFDYMGPITQRDKVGNNWLFASKSIGGSGGDGSAQRTYYDVVNAQASPYSGTGDQWTHREFDTDGNPIRVALANTPYQTSIGFNDNEGNWVEDVLTTNLFDGRHNLLSSTLLTNDGSSLQLVGTWTNWFDARDNRLGSMNPLNQTTRYAYDTNNQLLAVTNALNQVTRMAYDAKGNLTNLIDALNRNNRWTYDASGRNFEMFHADGLRISKGYDAMGRLGSVTNHGSGLYLSYDYDELNRMRNVLFPDGTSNHFEYSCCGLDFTRDRLNRITTYSRDAIGRTISVTDPAGHGTGFGYNGADQITRLTTTVGGDTRVKRFDYISTNGASRLTKVTTPMGKLIRYDYTFRGGLAWRQDGNGRVTKFQYDPLARLVSVTDSNDVELVGMSYDVMGNVTRVASTNSVFEYRYDALNRATNAVCLLTNLPGFAAVKYQIDYAFDPVGNVTNRLITGLQGMSGTITTRYQYDVMNRLTNVVQLTNNATTASAWYQYDAAGRLFKKGYGNGDVASHGYDMEGRLLSLGITNSTTLVTSYAYQLDAGGNILAITNNGTNITLYKYDAAGQLTNEISGTVTNSWQYDEAGNWLNADSGSRWVYDRDNELMGRTPTTATNTLLTVTGMVTNGYNSNKWYHSTAECRGVSALVSPVDGTFSLPGVPIYPGTNALLVTVTDVSGNQSQQVRMVGRTNLLEMSSYDGNGNLTNWVSGSTNWVYEWDWTDRMTKATSNGVVLLENYYNPFAQRTAKKEIAVGLTNYTLYLSDGFEIVGSANQSGQVLETFTRGVGLAGDIGTLVAVTHHDGSSTNGTFYIQGNHRGDIIQTRSGTATIGTYDYSAFGSLKTQTGTDVCRFKFSSKERDASTRFSYYGYRFYAPGWQRWLNSDPIEERGGINLYGFVRNNQISYYDPDGRQFYEPPILPPGDDPTKLPPEGSLACGIRIKNEVWDEFGTGPGKHLGDDHLHYAHCVAHCRIQRECAGGRVTSWLGGLGKEILDQLKKGLGKGGDGFDMGDMNANKEGRSRGRNCPKKSCEEACKGMEG
jgi:RHS repeat-associated protein